MRRLEVRDPVTRPLLEELKEEGIVVARHAVDRVCECDAYNALSNL